ASGAERAAGFSLRKDALLWPLVLGVCALVLVGESTNVVEVFLLRGTLGAGTVVFGLVAVVLALMLSVAGLAPVVWVFAVAWAFVGVANGVANVDASTLLLSRTPDFC